MVVAKAHRAHEVPPRGRDIGKKALGPGNRGHCKYSGLRRHHDGFGRIGNRTRRPERAGHLERRSNPGRPRHTIHGARIAGRYQRRIGDGRGCQRLPEAAARQRPIAQVFLGQQQQIDVPCDLEMLKAVVQHVNRRPQLAFGEPPGVVAVFADDHRDARQRAGQHQRLVTRRIDAGADRRAIRDDGDPFAPPAPAIPAREDGRTFARPEEQPRDIAATGVLPLPPTLRLPTLITGRDSLARRDARAYHRRRQTATALYIEPRA